MIQQIFNKVKQYSITIISLIIITLLFGGIVYFIYYLRKNNKQLQIIPEIKIVDMQKDIHVDILTETIEKSKEILKKVQQL